MLLLKCLPLVILGVISLAISFMVLRRGNKQYTNLAFALLALGVGGWVLGVTAFLVVDDPSLALKIAKIYYLFPLLIGSSMLVLASIFPDKRTIPIAIKFGSVAGFIVLAVPLLLIPDFVTKSLVFHDWGKEVVLNMPTYVLYGLFLVATFTVSLVILFAKLQHLKGLYRAQAKLLFVGIFVSALFGVLFNLIFPGFGNYSLIHLGPLASSFFLVATAYSILRHRMFNVQLIIVRSTAYVLALGFMVAIYAVSGYVLSVAAFDTVKNETLESLLNIVLLVVVAITFSPVKRSFDRITSRYFYRDGYDSEAFLSEVNKVVVGNVNVDVLLEQVADIVNKNLKTEFTLFELYKTAYLSRRVIGDKIHYSGGDIRLVSDFMTESTDHVVTTSSLQSVNAKVASTLQRLNIEIVAKLSPFPGQVSSGYGLLLLGPKKSGNQFTGQDINLIRIVAGELSIAVQNALRFEEIEQFNVTLQGKVNEATRKLRRTNEKLEAMDETKDEFISMASHQLRTPLTSVKGYVSMVLEGDAGPINDMQRKLLEQAFTSSQRMVFLIADLLNLSRLRTGKFIIEAVPTNLAEIIEGEVAQLKETAASRNLGLTYHKPDTFPTLMLDETKIRQVIMNFVDNAIYYTPTGGAIEITLTDTPKSIECTVRDNGIGVPKIEQPHLFNKFYRAKNAQKARPDGTGLGLFMAKKVIVAQGGAIIFKSAEGKGSTFGFSFSKEKLAPPA